MGLRYENYIYFKVNWHIYVIYRVSQKSLSILTKIRIKKNGLEVRKITQMCRFTLKYLFQSKSAHLRNLLYLKPVFLNSHCFSKWIVTFQAPYKLRKFASLLWNKYSFHTLKPFFLILITFQNSYWLFRHPVYPKIIIIHVIYEAFCFKCGRLCDGKRPLEKHGRRWEDNIKMDIQEMEWLGVAGGMDWIDVS
jgi:hypothetical protein